MKTFKEKTVRKQKKKTVLAEEREQNKQVTLVVINSVSHWTNGWE